MSDVGARAIVEQMSTTLKRVISLDLEFGSYEVGAGEGRELARLLRRRAEGLSGSPALTAAVHLEALVDEPAGRVSGGPIGEDELDAIADAAWDWLQRAGPDAFPERVLVLLDALRARHVHD